MNGHEMNESVLPADPDDLQECRQQARFKSAYVSETTLLLLLKPALGLPGAAAGAVPGCLPEGTEVRGIWEDRLGGCFRLSLWHPTFDIVPCGEYAPILHLAFTVGGDGR